AKKNGASRPRSFSSAARSERILVLAGLDRDPLQLGQFVHREVTALATKAAVLHAAERNDRLVTHAGAVDVAGTGLDAFGDQNGLLQVVGDDGRGQAVVAVVGQFQRVLPVVGLDQRSHRTEALG